MNIKKILESNHPLILATILEAKLIELEAEEKALDIYYQVRNPDKEEMRIRTVAMFKRHEIQNKITELKKKSSAESATIPTS